MAAGIWTIEHFTCPNCGMNYVATKEQHSEKQSGSFSCKVCNGEVHAWSGLDGFFDWKIDKAMSPVFGKRWGRESPPNALGPCARAPK